MLSNARPGHEDDPPDSGGSVDLRYIARAGLLPELSRQTYDSLWKATREAVLNSVDAGARRIEVDLSRVGTQSVMEVSDDGAGMSLAEFCERFMSLGGSGRYGDPTRFGRIGIGSLALLQYAETAIVESKLAGSQVYVRAEISHPWDLGGSQRQARLGDLPAGAARDLPYPGDADDHFTRVRLEGVNEHVQMLAADPAKFYGFCDRLRRVLPLPLAEGTFFDALNEIAPDLTSAIAKHVAAWSAPVVVHSPWERGITLVRRTYGDDASGTEQWSGRPVPLFKTVRVREGATSRRIALLGYLIAQKRASVAWSGITARVQNVAVEEQTFFDVSADPGFRKYISGEVWIAGDVSRERLINIDRASFNRESPDYKAVRRYMSECILKFKNTRVQRLQRAKVSVRKRLDQHVDAIDTVGRVVACLPAGVSLPSSERSRRVTVHQGMLATDLRALNAEVETCASGDAGPKGYALEATPDGRGVLARIADDLLNPSVNFGAVTYAVCLTRCGPHASPVVVRQRPRQIVLNLDHPSHVGADATAKLQASVALEFSYLLGADDGPEGVYEYMLEILKSL